MTTTASSTAVLTFQNTEFDVVDIHNVPWLRGSQIETALGYSQVGAIRNLFDRNADEFTDEMTQLMELPTAGGKMSLTGRQRLAYAGFTTKYTSGQPHTRQHAVFLCPLITQWRDDRPKYNTRKGNTVSRLVSVVESRRPHSGGIN